MRLARIQQKINSENNTCLGATKTISSRCKNIKTGIQNDDSKKAHSA
jgi:hypothetical protein